VPALTLHQICRLCVRIVAPLPAALCG